MSLRPLGSRRRILAALAATVLVLGACGGSDDDADGDDTTTTEADGGATTGEDEAASDEPAVDPYDGHTSEVYDEDASWICRPDLADDLCRDLDVVVTEADGTGPVEFMVADLEAPIDCFYVYPTVSADPGPNADLEWGPGDAEALTVVAQAAPYARSCRVFAPIYRQIPLTGLGGGAGGDEREVAYGDVLDAWQTYVSRWNEGRGVILIGHSQGTGHLARLIAEEIDDVPELQSRLVSAHLFGGSIQAPEGELVGGTFQEIPACTSADEAGCVVTWSSYPADSPPGDGAIFGRAGDGTRALCVDAVDLLDRELASPIVPVEAPLIGGQVAVPVGDDIAARFIGLPDALSVSCESTATHDYLAVAVAQGDDVRDREGLVTETLGPSWGLHLVDMSVALTDLVDLAARQSEAFAAG